MFYSSTVACAYAEYRYLLYSEKFKYVPKHKICCKKRDYRECDLYCLQEFIIFFKLNVSMRRIILCYTDIKSSY